MRNHRYGPRYGHSCFVLELSLVVDSEQYADAHAGQQHCQSYSG